MTPGKQNYTKIWHFNFLQFSWPRVHKISQKSDASIFSNHEFSQKSETSISWPLVNKISKKSDALIFFNFHDKTSQKSDASIFVKFFVPGVMKIAANLSVRFLCSFVYPRSWKLEKISASDFCEILFNRGNENWSFWFLWSFVYGHENWRKIKHLNFVTFLCTPEL